MQSIFTDYPGVPWKQGWRFFSAPENTAPFITGAAPGSLTVPGGKWTLQLIEPETVSASRLFCSGVSITAHKRHGEDRIHALLTEPGVFRGTFSGTVPRLTAATEIRKDNGFVWTQDGRSVVLLMQRETGFVLVCGELPLERAAGKAETALEENFELLAQRETEKRKKVGRLFSVNPRHNPPVALAAENLMSRLREHTGTIHGLWSQADGFPPGTFSLNELYPLVRAWGLIDPVTAMELVKTALSFQQSSGGFPSRVEAAGPVSAAAPWPLIAQSFEQAWRNVGDPALLRKHLPALRKYVQWAVRYFDPHRDLIPAWQNEQELFVPGNFERGKATPELTVLLITEIEAVLRLCEESEQTEAAESLTEERNRLMQTLDTVFWNPAVKAFSNVWNSGHYLHEPSFGSFLPLFCRGLDSEKRSALLEAFEETHSFPGHRENSSWNQDEVADTVHLPAIHQFMACEALRTADSARALLTLFVRRAREGFAAWFERESIEAARGGTDSLQAYDLGPVTAALVLTVQEEFEHEAARAPSTVRQLLKWGHRRRINKTDLRIASGMLLAILVIHLFYALPHSYDADARVAEAALNYQQGRYSETLRICRRYPHNALSRFLQANLLMLTGRTGEAETLYRQALTQKPESPSALFGLALALQMNGKLKEAEKRYGDFIDIHEAAHPETAELADEFIRLSREKFSKPPGWRRVYALPMMNDLGL